MEIFEFLVVVLLFSIIGCFCSFSNLLDKRSLEIESKDSVLEYKRRKIFERVYKRCKRKFFAKKSGESIRKLYNGDFETYVRVEINNALEWEDYYYEIE